MTERAFPATGAASFSLRMRLGAGSGVIALLALVVFLVFAPLAGLVTGSITDSPIGAPLLFHSVHRNASVPEDLWTSDMPLNDTLVHDADISRWLLDDEVKGVEVRVPRRNRRGKDLRDPTFVLLHMASGALVDVEISVNIAYGYDIRGEVSCEEGVASLPNRPAAIVSDRHGIRQAIPVDWRERFIEAYDQEFREWIVAASNGTAAGPSTWDGYAATLVADAALRAVDSGRLEEISMRAKPALYGPVAAA